MARRKGKGKSGRRIKGWHGRYHAGEDAEKKAHRGRKHTRRAVKLPPDRLAAPEQDQEDLPKAEGLVVAVYRRGATVRIGAEEVFCAIAKTFRAAENASALAVGDVATVALTQAHHTDGHLQIDGDRTEGMILSRRLRETALSRPRPTSARRVDRYQTDVFEQVIAANMDVLLIVAATRQPKLRPRLIERFLIVAERGELEPLLAVNKIDLAPPPKETVRELRDLGVDILPCSALTGEGLDALRARLAGRRSVLAGASGVGKSALINALVPDAGAATRAIRMKDQRGRHTTAAAAVYDLPALGAHASASGEQAELPVGVGPGGILVDTPGVRELGFAIDLEDLPWYFPEFEPFVPECHFNNCTHTHEPGCALLAAVEAGHVLRRRYESYLRIRESLTEGP
ncbi:MAG: ribosome small subunit-dependent GTPase A [Phycisphaerae bacterium]